MGSMEEAGSLHSQRGREGEIFIPVYPLSTLQGYGLVGLQKTPAEGKLFTWLPVQLSQKLLGVCVSKVRRKRLCQKQPHRRGSLNRTQDGETRLGGSNSCGPCTRTPDTNYIRQTAQPPDLIPSGRRKASDSLSVIKTDAIFRVFQMPFMRLGKLFSISGLLGVSVFGRLTVSRCLFHTY